jgi:hypothetical protein
VVWSLRGSCLVNLLLCNGITDKSSYRDHINQAWLKFPRNIHKKHTSWYLRNYVGITQVTSILYGESIHWIWVTATLVNTGACPMSHASRKSFVVCARACAWWGGRGMSLKTSCPGCCSHHVPWTHSADVQRLSPCWVKIVEQQSPSTTRLHPTAIL